MRYRFVIEVTQEDINNGKRGNCRKCPVALACMRSMPGFVVDVSTREIFIQHTSEHIVKSVPMSYTVRDFVVNFDSHGYVEPFSFVLEFDA